jgi:hypothetical protein
MTQHLQIYIFFLIQAQKHHNFFIFFNKNIPSSPTRDIPEPSLRLRLASKSTPNLHQTYTEPTATID